MTDERTVIRDSIRQVKEIYEQVSVFIVTADGLMREKDWNPSGNTVVYESNATYDRPSGWLPSILTREYRNRRAKNMVLLMGIILDHQDIKEPLVIGTQMSVIDVSEKFPYTNNDDRYFWFLKKANFDAIGEVVEIEDPKEVYEKETRDLSRILTFATPLLEIKNSEQMREKFVTKLLELAR